MCASDFTWGDVSDRSPMSSSLSRRSMILILLNPTGSRKLRREFAVHGRAPNAVSLRDQFEANCLRLAAAFGD
jgi:hypothetical protein